MKTKPEPATVTEARKYLGYRAQPQRRSNLQHKVFQGLPWNGTFIDRVLDEVGLNEASFVSTVNALGYFVNRNRVYQKPRVGDIVFFNFATDPQNMFEQPHVGVVTDTSRWKTDGAIRTIEGETGPGTPHGSQIPDGVFERVRYRWDVIGFVRPKARTVHTVGKSVPIKLSYFKSNPKTRARVSDVVQTALRKVGFTGFKTGAWDGYTRSAFGQYARNRDFVANRGEAEQNALATLGRETVEFEIRE